MEVRGLDEDKKRKLNGNRVHVFCKNENGSSKCSQCGRSMKFEDKITNGLASRIALINWSRNVNQ